MLNTREQIDEMNRRIVVNERVGYGLIREPIVFEYLNDKFENTLRRSQWKSNFFDFYCAKSKYLIELKSLRYSIDYYDTVVMNYSKTQKGYDRMIFIFEYNEEDGKYLYYHEYDSSHKYNRRLMKMCLEYKDVIDIDKSDMVLIDKNDINTKLYCDNDDITDALSNKFNSIIMEDSMKFQYGY